MAMLYQLYLHLGTSQLHFPDPITHLVAQQSETLIESFGYTADIRPHETESSMRLSVNEVYLARIVEGCNAVSVIILFIAFILAFFDTWKTTIVYCLAGATLIYGLNIVRIALLCIGIYEYPEHYHLLHGVLFPLVIYGIVFVLWIMLHYFKP